MPRLLAQRRLDKWYGDAPDPRFEFFSLVKGVAQLQRRGDGADEIASLRDRIAELRPSIYGLSHSDSKGAYDPAVALPARLTTRVMGDAIFSEASVPEVQAMLRDPEGQIISEAIPGMTTTPGRLRWRRRRDGAWAAREGINAALRIWFLGLILGFICCGVLATGLTLLMPPSANAPRSGSDVQDALFLGGAIVAPSIPLAVVWWCLCRITLRRVVVHDDDDNQPLITVVSGILHRDQTTLSAREATISWHDYRQFMNMRTRSGIRFTHKRGVRTPWSCAMLLGPSHAILLGVTRTDKQRERLYSSLPGALRALPQIDGCALGVEPTKGEHRNYFRRIIPTGVLA